MELVLLSHVDCIVLICGAKSVEALISCPDGLGCLVLYSGLVETVDKENWKRKIMFLCPRR